MNKSDKFYKRTAKAVAYEGLVGQMDSLTTQPLSIVRAASQKAQLVHNAEVQGVQTKEVSGDVPMLDCISRKTVSKFS